MALVPDDFEAYFEQVHGHAPFRWQSRLLRDVIAAGRWPDVLALPTGSGKTSAIDIALFAFALAPHRFPRRILLVVDRRVVVDQAAEHGNNVLRALAAAHHGAARSVADALRSAWEGQPDDPPFAVAVMRGGMPRDDAWARRPDQPVVAASTVDQVGSRLLFRGYGVSDAMASVHAGLLGHDALILLDEVHLAVPFAQTLLAVRQRWRANPAGLPDRWGVVRMSATPGLELPGDVTFGLGPDDDRDVRLAQRRSATKPTRLGPIVEGPTELAERSAQEALAAVQQGARAVAVVVNRVDSARRVHSALAGRCDSVLLTGRMRPLDREAILDAGLLARIRAGRQRDPAAAPVVVVATQCIEAGADFDFDALVTECASIDALRQRFGRLDRLGELGGGAQGLILVQKPALTGRDPVYGDAIARTWEWLQQHGDQVGMGIEELHLPHGESLRPLLAPVVDAPVLLPSHLDAWVQTRPRPTPDPDVALWLHGTEPRRPEVRVVWRADITAEELHHAREGGAPADLVGKLEACPPVPLEAMSLPISAVRAWLAGLAPAPVSDATQAEADTDLPATAATQRPCVRWRTNDVQVILPGSVRPDDTLVVPAEYGGLSHGSWDATATAPVGDVAERATWRQRGRALVRLDPRVVPEVLVDDLPGPLAPDDDRRLTDVVRGWLRTRPTMDAEWTALFEALGPRPRIVHATSQTLVLIARRRTHLGDGGEVVTEDDNSSWTGAVVPLPTHLDDVAAQASAFAAAIGLPRQLTSDLALAARMHDIGKVDPRFQQMLCGGDPIKAAALDQPLAKSSMDPRDRRLRQRARDRSRCPPQFRHELLSAAMLARAPNVLAQASDPDLVLHLVASHHGWCRPLPPPWSDPDRHVAHLSLDGQDLSAPVDHGLERIGSGVTDRFWDLVARYGWWGLAWLEAILRLADHRASEDEQRREEDENGA